MWPNPQFPAHLVTFTEEIRNGKLLFFCAMRGACSLYRFVSPAHINAQPYFSFIMVYRDYYNGFKMLVHLLLYLAVLTFQAHLNFLSHFIRNAPDFLRH